WSIISFVSPSASFRVRLTHPDVQLPQLLGIHLTGRLGHDTGSTLRFRECNHFPNGAGATHEHDQTVQSECQSTMGRRAVLEGIQQEAEFFLLFFSRNTQYTEHGLLHILTMDTHGTATELGTVEHHVIGTGQSGQRVGFQLFRRAVGRSERVVQCTDAAVIVLFKHREVDYPQGSPLTGKQIEVVAQLDPQRTQGFADDLGGVGTKEHDITVFCLNPVQNRLHLVFGNKLQNRRLEPFHAFAALVDLDVGQPFGAIDTDILGVVVNFLTGQLAPLGQAQCRHAAVGIISRATEHLELHILEQALHINQLQGDPHVRLVGAIAAHGLGVAHPGEVTQLHIQHFLEQGTDHAFSDSHDFLFTEETGFDINLGEFRLTIGPQVFVTETFGDLVITVKARHHQQLLKELRRLGQGKEAARMSPAGNQIVTSPFWCCLGQNRRFHIQETLLVQVSTQAGRNTGTQPQLVGHFRATQIQEAIAQSNVFTHIGIFIQGEWRGFGLVQHNQALGQNLDLTGHHVGVVGSFRPHPDLSGYLNHVLAADPISQLETFLIVRIEDYLGNAFAITDIQENNTAVVTPPVNPTTQG